MQLAGRDKRKRVRVQSATAWVMLSGVLLLAGGCGRQQAEPAINAVADTDATPREVHPADTVLRGGVLYTAEPSSRDAQALAITEGLIAYVGSDAGVVAHIGPSTRVVDLAGAMVMPGIVDGHIHAVRGGLNSLLGCTFAFSATPTQIRERVAPCVEDQPDALWIRGGQWDSGFFERFDIPSPRAFLDEVSGDKAVYLADDALHNAWVNSKALALAGVDGDTPDPPGGRYARDADGNPNGLLIETAPKAVAAVIPDYSREQYQAGAVEFARIANAFGVTSVKDAGPTETEMRAYYDADQAGKLTVNVATSIRTPYGHREHALDYAAIEALRDRFASTHVHTAFVKIFLDGVPTPARTAAMLAPYLPDELHGHEFTGGPLHVPMTLLVPDLIALDARGFTVKLHAAGDRSVRRGLDAIEAVRAANPSRALRHELAHAGYIDPADIPRFAQLNAVADLSPIIWFPSPIIDSIVTALGERRALAYWPVRDLIDHNAPLLSGSDWPAAVPDANPWMGIEALITRRDPRGKHAGVLWAEQAITLAEALQIYTLDGARALRLEDKTGSLTIGKSADIIVLNHNLFEIAPEHISDTRVVRTFFEGQSVVGE